MYCNKLCMCISGVAEGSNSGGAPIKTFPEKVGGLKPPYEANPSKSGAAKAP